MLMIDRTRPGALGPLRDTPAAFPDPPPDPRRIHGLRAEWRRLARILADPSVELTSETVTPLLACHGRLVAAGVKLDAMADALLRQLAYQLVTSEACL